MNRLGKKSSKTTKKTTKTTAKRSLKTAAKRSATRRVVKASKRTMSTTFANKVVGVIGLGNMGGHMANNLLSGGNNIAVFDVFDQAVQNAVNHGKEVGKNVLAAKSPYEVAMASDIVITMLPSSKHVKDTFAADNGLLKAIQDRKAQGKSKILFIDSSTISPETTSQVKDLVGDEGDFIDAPVSGGVMGAKNATLTFMVGGTPEQFEESKNVLSKMGKNIVHCGPTGSGQAAKICNNLILGISMNAISEGYNLGVKLGLDPKVLAGIVNTSSGRCWASEISNPVPGVVPTAPASREYQGGFGVDLMLKDMNLAIEAADSVGATLQLGKQAAANYQAISTGGDGKKDFGFVYQHVSKM